MTRPPPLLPPSKLLGPTAESVDAILQIKVRLVGVSPMIWRRVLVAADTTLRELHGGEHQDLWEIARPAVSVIDVPPTIPDALDAGPVEDAIKVHLGLPR